MRRWLAPADALLQQLAWWWTVLWAAHGRPELAAAGGPAAVALHLLLRRRERGRIAAMALSASLVGFAVDSLLGGGALLSFAGGGPVSPAWMVGLWAAFGVSLTGSLRLLVRWPPPAVAAAGALAGPLAYRGGVALGALRAAGGIVPWAAVAAGWSVALSLLVALARSPEARRERARRPVPVRRWRWAR